MDKKEELIKEAIKRGYVEGVATFDLYYAKPKQVTLPKFKGWDYSSGCLWYDVDDGSNNSIVVFDRDNGWAEIIKPEIKKEPMTIEQLEKQKAEIDKQIEELKKSKFEDGKWYFNSSDKLGLSWIWKFKSIKGDIIDVYCHSCNGSFYDEITENYLNITDSSSKNIRLATKEEIESVLIPEAKRRYSGKNFKCLNNNSRYNNLDFNFNYIQDISSKIPEGIHADNGWCYINGKWADVVESKLKIGDYEVKWEDDTLHVGCKRININTVKELKTLMSNLNMNIINLLGLPVTKDTIEKILNLKHK